MINVQYDQIQYDEPTDEVVCLWFDPAAPYEARWVVSDADFEGPPKNRLAAFAEDNHSDAKIFACDQARERGWLTCVEVVEDGAHVPIGGPGS